MPTYANEKNRSGCDGAGAKQARFGRAGRDGHKPGAPDGRQGPLSGLAGLLTHSGMPPPSAMAQTAIDWLLTGACDGLPMFESAHALADRYRYDTAGCPRSPHEAANALIRAETTKSFSAGFASGMAGVFAWPVALPAGMAVSFVLHARLAGAIALLFGHDVNDRAVRTSILMSLQAAETSERMQHITSQLRQWATARALGCVSSVAVEQIKTRIGQKLWLGATRGKKLVRLGRALPVFGALVAGGADAFGCRRVAQHALALFEPAGTTSADLAQT